jgi:hypothetical protein
VALSTVESRTGFNRRNVDQRNHFEIDAID